VAAPQRRRKQFNYKFLVTYPYGLATKKKKHKLEMVKCQPGETYNTTLKACRPQKKRGRKPGTSKYNCPKGQTYNRSIKACRTMKKRGRPTKKSSKTPMPPTPKAFIVNATRKNFPALPKSKSSSPKRVTFTMHAAGVSRISFEPLSNNDYSDKIIKWYLPYIADYDLGTNPSMTYDKKTNEYTVSFTPDPEFPTDPKKQLLELGMFADPDDDGNYPIKVDNKTYLISGQVVTLNGVKV
jgi:hypothetical protein